MNAFLVRVDGKLAGFALLAGKSRLTGEDGVRDVVVRAFELHELEGLRERIDELGRSRSWPQSDRIDAA